MARTKDKAKPAQIIDAAFAVFGESGFEATGIKDIAARAGISAGTIYTYFRDKRELFQATAREGWRRFLAQTASLVDAEGPVEERLARMLAMGFDALRQHLPLLRGMLFESSQARILQESIDALCDAVDRLLRARAAGRPLVPDPAARRAVLRITLVGVLFTAALADPARVDAEIEGTRATIERMLAGR